MKLTHDEEKAYVTVIKQHFELLKQGVNQEKITLTCPTCGMKRKLLSMYRCYECNKYICIRCVEKHFGVHQLKLGDKNANR